MATSSDEGEILENDVDLKATSLPRAAAEGSGVDRQDRPRSRLSSPENDSASRYSGSSRRSRSPRGYKRSRDDRDSYGRTAREHDSRGRRAPYDARRRDNYQRSRVSYEDLDHPTSRGPHNVYDERDWGRDRSRDRERYRDVRDHERYPDKRPRNRSRSTDRSRRTGRDRLDRFVRESQPDRRNDTNGGLRYEDDRGPRQRESASVKTSVGEAERARKYDAKSEKGPARDNQSSERHVKQMELSKQPEPEPEPDYQEPEPIDEEAEIERRRKRRAELLAKSSSATPLLLHAVGATGKTREASPASAVTPQGSQMDVDSPQTPGTPRTPRTPRSGEASEAQVNATPADLVDLASPRSPGSNDEPSPGGMELLDENNLMNTHSNAKRDDEDGPSAADYDPTVDMKEDERRDELRHGQTIVHGEAHVVETTEKQPEVDTQETKAQKVSEDDDDFDMFAEDFDEDKYATQPAPATGPIEAVEPDAEAQAKGGILEGDDKDGYYKMRIGEVLGGRYQVQAALGKGMFSNVVRAIDITTKKLVAIKIMRNNDALRKGGYTEITILEKLNAADPENRKHIVKFERSFDYRSHLCMAFENLSLNLREVLKKFGNNVGINLGATRAYAHQIFVALAHMRKCSIIHADLKPDNILVNESRNVLKICDLGTAIDRSDAATAHTGITPYLVSRFYRAPEIMLGMPYDYGVDMWSIGCTLYELYTGKILFAGDSNNQMLKAIMEIRGRLTPKLYKRGQLSAQHFDEAGQFISVERDKVLGKTTVRTLPMVKPTRDLRTRLMAASTGMNDTEARELHHFVDLLDHCLALNPDKRLKPADALRHPFFTSKSSAPRR